MKKRLKDNEFWFGFKKEALDQKVSASRETLEGEGYFHREEKEEIVGCLKSCLDISFNRSIQTSVVNSHTVTYKHIAPADNAAQLEFNCSGHSDYYIDLNSVCIIFRIKLVKLMDLITKILRKTQ